MKKITALLALLLCAVMLLGVLTACAEKGQNDIDQQQNSQNDNNTQSENTYEPFDLSDVDISKVSYYIPGENQIGFIENNGERIVPEYILKVNGVPVTVEEFRYPYLNIKYGLDNGDDSLWSQDAPAEQGLTQEDIDSLEKDTIDYLKQTTLYQLLAAKYGVSLTDEEKKEVEDSIKSTIETMNAEGSEMTYEQALEESYYSDSLYRYTLNMYSLANKVFSHLYFDEGAPLGYTNEQMVQKLADEGYVRTQQILIKFPDQPTEGTDEEKAAAVQAGKDTAKKEAEEVLEKVNAGEDFMALVEQYNDDPGMDYYGENGYYFGAGEMVEEYEKASFALEEGQVSGLVETPYGYHIIKRLPLQAEYISENALDFFGEEFSIDFSGRLEKTMQEMTVEYAPEYELISPTTLK